MTAFKTLVAIALLIGVSASANASAYMIDAYESYDARGARVPMHTLVVSENEAVPAGWTAIQDRVNVNLSNLGLDKIDGEGYALKPARNINLSQNRFFNFPLNLTYLVNVQEINLSNNKISILPEFGSLSMTLALNLAHNNISALPLSLLNLRLTSLDLRGNPIQTLSPAMFQAAANNNADWVQNPVIKKALNNTVVISHFSHNGCQVLWEAPNAAQDN